jgi:hypothetical protein
MSNKEKTDNFVVWTLKPEFDDAIITESDVVYYKKMKNLNRHDSVVLKRSDNTLREVFWAE